MWTLRPVTDKVMKAATFKVCEFIGKQMRMEVGVLQEYPGIQKMSIVRFSASL